MKTAPALIARYREFIAAVERASVAPADEPLREVLTPPNEYAKAVVGAFLEARRGIPHGPCRQAMLRADAAVEAFMDAVGR